MLFTQIEFAFLFFALLGCLKLIRSNTARKILVLVASYYFYAYWDYRFLALLLVPTLLDYAVGRLLSSTANSVRRKFWVALSVSVNIGILGFFKYCNFFISSFQSVFSGLGTNLTTMNIILPLGLSFYTLKTLSYVLDVYRNKMEACSSLLDYAVFISFFPNPPCWSDCQGRYVSASVEILSDAFLADFLRRIQILRDRPFHESIFWRIE